MWNSWASRSCLTSKHPIPPDESPQGVHLVDPTDYFRRISAEQLDLDELRDQTVLGDIREWQRSGSRQLTDRLASSDADGDRYASVWEHFSGLHSPKELVQLASRVVHTLLEVDGSRPTLRHPAVLAIWRVFQRRETDGNNKHLILDLIQSSVPNHVVFAVDFFHYWTSADARIVTSEEREEIRCTLVESIQRTLHTSADFVPHLGDSDAVTVYALITKTGKDDGGSPFELWSDHFAPILADGAKRYPAQFLPELANLLATDNSTMRSPDRYPPIFRHEYEINRGRAQALLGQFLDDVLVELSNYGDHDPYAQRATQAATAWLQERRDKAE